MDYCECSGPSYQECYECAERLPGRFHPVVSNEGLFLYECFCNGSITKAEHLDKFDFKFWNGLKPDRIATYEN